MNRKSWTLLALVPALLFPASFRAEDSLPPEDEAELTAEIAYREADTEREAFRAAEYESADDRPFVSLHWMSSPYSKKRFDVSWERLSYAEQSASFYLDLDRWLLVDATFDGLLHRLDHDPLTNLQAVSDIKVVRSTDFDPTTEYSIVRHLYDAEVAVRPPAAGWLTVRAGYRDEKRDGTRQILTTSHCTSCHVTAQGREVDQSTRDLLVGAHARLGRVDLDYQLVSRTFEDRGAVPTAPYERAYHPATTSVAGCTDPALCTLTLPFEDRLWFQNGQFPVGRVPDSDRTIHELKARIGFDRGSHLNLSAVLSGTENSETGRGYDFNGYRARYAWNPKDSLSLVFHGRRDQIQTDAYVVDLLALNGLESAPVSSYPAPVANTYTYEEWRQLVEADPTLNFSDFTWASSLDRTDTAFGVDAVWRPRRRASLRLAYEGRKLERDHTVLADGTGDTTYHTFKAAWNQRLAKKVRWNTSLAYQMADNPWASLKAACSAYDPDFIGIATTPKSPSSLQYYQIHERRVADLSNQPSDQIRFRSQATWSPKGSWALSGNLRYRSAENDDLNTSTWEQETAGAGIGFWAALGRGQFTVGYDAYRQRTDTKVCIPLMDG